MVLKNKINFDNFQVPLTKEQQIAKYMAEIREPINLSNSTMQMPVTEQQPAKTKPSFISSALDYIKSPEGIETLTDALGLAIGATSSSPYVASAMAQGYKDTVNKRISDKKLRQQMNRQNQIDALNQAYKLALIEETQMPKISDNTPINLPENIKETTEDYLELFDKDFIAPYIGKYTLKRDGKTMTVPTISKEGLEKINELKETGAKQLNQARDDAQMIDFNVNKLLESPSLKKLVGTQQIVGAINVPKEKLRSTFSTLDENDFTFLETLQTVVSDKFLNTLKATRSEKTGATGFGQLNEKEFDTLQKSLASLKTNQSPESFIENLNIVRNTLLTAKLRAEEKYLKTFGDLPEYRSVRLPNYDLPSGNLRTDDNDLGDGFRIRSIR